MKKILLFTLILFIFLSCGIPIIKNFEKDIYFSTSVTNNSFTFGFDQAGYNGAEFYTNSINNSSPSIALMYVITNNSNTYEDNEEREIAKAFSTKFRGSNEINGLPLSSVNNRLFSVDTSSLKIDIYPLYDEESNKTYQIPKYTLYNRNDYVFTTLDSLNYITYKFKLEDNKLILENAQDDTKNKRLLRYDGSLFNTTEISNYPEASHLTDFTNVYLHIYAAVNITKGDSATFNNDYWTKLKKVAVIKIE